MTSLALAFDILARDKGASKTLDQFGDKAEQTGRRLGDAGERGGSRLGSGISAGVKIAAAAVVGLGAAAAVGIKSAVSEASNLGESVNAVKVVFGDASAGILKLGENAARAVGLSNAEFNGLAVQFSSFATKVAGPGGDVTKTLEGLTGRAADFASVMNLDVSEAAGIFQSALSGETEPIKKFGIDLSAAAVQAFAAANGIGTVGKELTEGEKVQARYGLLMAETAKTQGDFANTSDSLANRQRILGATFDNIKARVGSAFLPVMEKVAGFVLTTLIPAVEQIIGILFKGDFKGGGPFSEDGKLTDIVFDIREAFVQFKNYVQAEVLPRLRELGGFLKEDVAPILKTVGEFVLRNKDYFVTFVATLGTLVAVIKVWTAVQAVLNVVLTANPIGLVVVAIAALVAGLILAYRNSDTFREIVDRAFKTVATAATFLWENVFKPYFGFIIGIYKLAWEAAQTFARHVGVAFDGVKSAVMFLVDNIVRPYLTAFITVWSTAAQAVLGTAARVASALGMDGLAEKLRGAEEAVKGSAKSATDALNGIPKKFDITVVARTEGFRDAAAAARNAAGDGPGAGGPALARVSKLIAGTGAYVTSTYRSPARNRAVGGSPTSFHLDPNNPAVDVVGPNAVLDRLAAQLRGTGRELLWKVPGHFDHLHYAHNGGTVSSSWPTMPGLRSDERPVITQVGETIVPRDGGGTTARLHPDDIRALASALRDGADARVLAIAGSVGSASSKGRSVL